MKAVREATRLEPRRAKTGSKKGGRTERVQAMQRKTQNVDLLLLSSSTSVSAIEQLIRASMEALVSTLQCDVSFNAWRNADFREDRKVR